MMPQRLHRRILAHLAVLVTVSCVVVGSSQTMAAAAGNSQLEWISVLNTARLYVRRGDADQAEILLANAAKGFAALPARAQGDGTDVDCAPGDGA